MAGAGQTYNHKYPSFLGMVGLRLHIVNETLIRNLKSRATGGKGAEFSLVRKQLHFWTLCGNYNNDDKGTLFTVGNTKQLQKDKIVTPPLNYRN